MNIPGEIFSLMAAFFWSIAVVTFRSLTQKLSPFLINALKNTIGLACFIILLCILKIPLWDSTREFESLHYLEFIVSGFLGMGIADAIFIYALSKIGANRIAILNCFEPIVIYCLTPFFLPAIWLNEIQTIGFMIVIISMLIISYERDEIDINPKIKQQGIMLQICAILCSCISMLMIKDTLNGLEENNDYRTILWVTAFRLFIGFVISWTIFLFLKDTKKLLKALKEKIVITKIITSSIFGTFMALTCWMMGQAYVKNLALASIIGQTSLIFIMLFSWLFLREKITKTRIIASIFALLGVFLSNYFI